MSAGEDTARAAALKAIVHVLDRACETGERESIGYYLAPMTESWSLLVAAEAELLGVDRGAHESWREKLWGGDRAEINIATAWRDYVDGKRGDVLVPRNGRDPAAAAVVRRAGAWAVLRFEHIGSRTVCSLTHGPTGRAAVQGDALEAELLEHLTAIEQLGGRALAGHDMTTVGALLRARGAIP